MSSKGKRNTSKRISAPKAIHIERKSHFWLVKSSAGPHNKESSIPLGVLLRDYAKAVATMKEAKHAMHAKLVTVNGVVRVNHQFPVGLFDVVAIAKQGIFFRVVLDGRERMVLNKLEKESKEKIVKVTGKTTTSRGLQISTDDGRTFYGVKANNGDSLKLTLPEGKAGEVIEFKEGALVYVLKGAQCATTATVKSIVAGTARKEELVKLVSGKEEFETIAKNVVVIGKKASAIEDLV